MGSSKQVCCAVASKVLLGVENEAARGICMHTCKSVKPLLVICTLKQSHSLEYAWNFTLDYSPWFSLNFLKKSWTIVHVFY